MSGLCIGHIGHRMSRTHFMANVVNSGTQSHPDRKDVGVKMCADLWGGEEPAVSPLQLPQGDVHLVVLPLPSTGTELTEQLLSGFDEHTNH